MEVLSIHPETPQQRWINRISEVFAKGGIVVYPTDSGYSVGCDATNIKAINKLYALKKPLKKYYMSLLLSDISAISEYAKLDNNAFRYIKSRVPGHYTFILPAQTHIVRKLGVKRHEIGVRIPKHPFLDALFESYPNPILNTAARYAEDVNFTHPDDLVEAFKNRVDLIVTCGEIQLNPTNIIYMVEKDFEILRGTDEEGY